MFATFIETNRRAAAPWPRTHSSQLKCDYRLPYYAHAVSYIIRLRTFWALHCIESQPRCFLRGVSLHGFVLFVGKLLFVLVFTQYKWEKRLVSCTLNILMTDQKYPAFGLECFVLSGGPLANGLAAPQLHSNTGVGNCQYCQRDDIINGQQNHRIPESKHH